ncbi:hypothetical protein GYA93_21990 [Gordonia desulfuricans]|uniref:Uncharacterized protein n=1 Tax=Gordonia desulfuricans TaxID=89051 RepID=A0A7K3LV93_9ACTN|nr:MULTISPECIES: hypothetical protein [Gordonia]EMP14250.2 hypothetical protein ISGA_895 [Gordonia sp. NB41Y]NDK92210.1 hypothetical protein [Gordonia desulfuricans]WLP92640.1 hypothetical protein Q9K23_10640 [Gordonia sp. NB41Y]
MDHRGISGDLANGRIDDDRTDVWLVDAGRELGNLSSDASRLVAAITADLGTVLRPGRPLDTDTVGVCVSDRVLKQILAVGIRRALGRLVVFVSVDGDDDAVDRLRVGLIARYGDILPDRSDDVREVARTVLADLLGPEHARAASARIDVRWQDLETRDWWESPAAD